MAFHSAPVAAGAAEPVIPEIWWLMAKGRDELCTRPNGMLNLARSILARYQLGGWLKSGLTWA